MSEYDIKADEIPPAPMTTLTLTHDPGGEEHYWVSDGTHYVGRIYQADTNRWVWSLGYDVTWPRNPPYGHETSCDTAMEKFKAAYVAIPRPQAQEIPPSQGCRSRTSI